MGSGLLTFLKSWESENRGTYCDSPARNLTLAQAEEQMRQRDREYRPELEALEKSEYITWKP